MEVIVEMERFLSHFEKSSPEECWLWMGSKWANGYGHMRGKCGKKSVLVAAHRISFALAHPKTRIDHLCILHRCDVPACINPHHLFAGTMADNMRDKMKKGRGRWVRGEQHPLSKLNMEKVAEIRRLRASGWGLRLLSLSFKVSIHSIWMVVKGKAWVQKNDKR